MFTPQRRRVLSGEWSLTKRTLPPGKVAAGSEPGRDGKGKGKGKGVIGLEPLTPNGVGPALDQEGSVDKISNLQTELFEYQYNMGLLLIEKKEWASKLQDIRQSLTEAKDALKQEQAAHLIAISDAEKREENLRNALGVEKQCVIDLEKAVREMRSEIAEIKFTADSKLAEANALISSVEEKSLEVETKLRSVDAKLAEVSRKSSEIERKTQEVESQESLLRRERLSFIAEREVHDTTLAKQREDLYDWEKKLQEGEERLAKGQRIINQREERASENDKIFKQKQKDLDEAQKKINEANTILKRKEDDISSRLANLKLKEKEFDDRTKRVDLRAEELQAFKERLNDREQIAIQKLLDEHNAILDEKKREFELEAEQKRKSLDEYLKGKVIEVEKKEIEVRHMEEKIVKREQALDHRQDKLKEKEQEFEVKSKALKEREKSFKSEEKNLEIQSKQMLFDKEELLNLKAELENIRAANEEQLLHIRVEKEQLRVSEVERSEFVRLQCELKGELEKCRLQQELLLKEAEDLKQQKENFEREWEDLDEKRAQVDKELKSIGEQKEKFERQRHLEEERLKEEKRSMEEYVERELQALQVAKEAFEANMEHEHSVLTEKAQIERNHMLHDIETHRNKQENDLQRRREEMDKILSEKERLFEEEKERELANANFLRDTARREMEDLKLERVRIEKERQEVEENKKHLHEQQLEMREDIDALGDLSQKLKDDREQFVKEKERFILFVEQHKSCKDCGEITSQFVLSNLVSSQEIENAVVLPTPKPALEGGNLFSISPDQQRSEMSPTTVRSVSPVSWLRKCTSKIFNFSPGKKIDPTAAESLTENVLSGGVLPENESEQSRLRITEIEPDILFAVVNDSIDMVRAQSDTSIRDAKASLELSIDEEVNNKGSGDEDSQPTALQRGHQSHKRGRPRVIRTRTMKAVVDEGKAILGEGLERDENGELGHSKAESHDESGPVDKKTVKAGRKRSRATTSQATASGHDGNESDGKFDSVAASEQRKKHQKVAPALGPGETRYNLRRPKLAGSVMTSKASSDLIRQEDGVGGQEDGLEATPVASTGVASQNGGSTHLVRCGKVVQQIDANNSRKLVDNVTFSEEVNGTPEGAGEHGIVDDDESVSCGEDDQVDEDKGDDDESLCPGEVSIGKKLWTFFTT